MAFGRHKEFGSWAMNCGETTYNNDMEWQFRVSILPTEDNINKAYDAINTVKQLNETDHPDAKLMLVNAETMNRWDGTLQDASDRDQRGKELCVYMDIADTTNDTFAFTKDYFKHLMLDIWKALEDAGVEISYITKTNDEKEIACSPSILTPFTYSSSKPYKTEDGILHSDEYNPKKHPDPLEGLYFSEDDLKKKGIKNYDALEISKSRIDYMEHHAKETKEYFSEKINSLASCHSSYLYQNNKTFNLIKDFQPSLSLLDTIAYNIDCYFPSNFEDGKRCSLFKYGLLKDSFKNGQLTQEKLIAEYNNIQQNAKEIIEKLTEKLQTMDWPIEKPSHDVIANLVNNHPYEMQSMQRQFIHLEHEIAAIDKEKARYDDLLAIDTANKKEQSEQSQLKLKTIAKAVLKAATVSSTVGTLFGVGIGATLVATGLFAPLGAGVLGILAVSATIGLASSVLGALFVGLTSLLIETIRYQAKTPSVEFQFTDLPTQSSSSSSEEDDSIIFGQ